MSSYCSSCKVEDFVHLMLMLLKRRNWMFKDCTNSRTCNCGFNGDCINSINGSQIREGLSPDTLKVHVTRLGFFFFP
jgi:hypothetical protein